MNDTISSLIAPNIAVPCNASILLFSMNARLPRSDGRGIDPSLRLYQPRRIQ